MYMEKERNKRIDEIMGSLDNVQRATVPDFFYTRLKARMESELVAEPRSSGVFRPLYIFGVLVVVLAINAAVIFKGSASETSVPDSDTMQSIAAEYKINSNLTYEINQ